MKSNYGFTVINDDDPEEVLHLVGFQNKPTEWHWNHILEELDTDPEFNCYLSDYRWSMRYSTDEEVEFINKQVELRENGNRNPDLNIDIHSKQERQRNTDIKH